LIEGVTTLLGIDNGKTNEKLTPVAKPLFNKDLDGVTQKSTGNIVAQSGC
jgi:hypothetical protein